MFSKRLKLALTFKRVAITVALCLTYQMVSSMDLKLIPESKDDKTLRKKIYNYCNKQFSSNIGINLLRRKLLLDEDKTKSHIDFSLKPVQDLAKIIHKNYKSNFAQITKILESFSYSTSDFIKNILENPSRSTSDSTSDVKNQINELLKSNDFNKCYKELSLQYHPDKNNGYDKVMQNLNAIKEDPCTFIKNSYEKIELMNEFEGIDVRKVLENHIDNLNVKIVKDAKDHLASEPG